MNEPPVVVDSPVAVGPQNPPAALPDPIEAASSALFAALKTQREKKAALNQVIAHQDELKRQNLALNQELAEAIDSTHKARAAFEQACEAEDLAGHKPVVLASAE